MNRLFTFSFLFLNVVATNADVLSQWRGPHRDGVYAEKNLLHEWPEGGPELLWSFEGLGKGHGSAAIADGKIYVTGMPDTLGVLYAFSLNGKLLWKKVYGPEWSGSYPGARTTPTIVDHLLYLESGRGVVYCFNRHTGELLWSKDLLKTFDAKNIRWGMAESLLIDGDRVICTPGGPVHNVAALNRFTGETVWTAKGHGEPAAYCSPILINHNGVRIIVAMTAGSIIGVDADEGRTLWRVQQDQGNKIHANTPLYFDGKILCSSSSARTDHYGLVLLSLSKNGDRVETIWRNLEYTNLMGGVIKKGDYLYGGKYRRKEWYCINLNTGAVQYVHKGFGAGAIVEADGLFYCYSESGELALVDATPEGFRIISSFEIPLGTDQHWAHPAIKDGRLYVRHGDALMVYDISEKEK